MATIVWTDVTNQSLTWTSLGSNVIQYATPVRNNTPLSLSYTFKDQNGAIINLTGFTLPILETKLQGQLFSSVVATVTTPATGVITYTGFVPIGPGVWDAQFSITDAGSNKVYGGPLQFTVVPNVDDLAISQLPLY